MQAVTASQVDVMAVPAEAMARDGRPRIVAVISPERLELLPAAPTLRELGVDLVIGLWQALYAPARTPAPVVARLNPAAHEAMRAPSFVAAMRTQAAPEGLAALLMLPDGRGIYESRFILEWLEAKHPDPSLLPLGSDGALAARQVEVIADGICDAPVLLFWERHREEEMQSAPWTARQRRKVDGGLRALAGLVEKRDGDRT